MPTLIDDSDDSGKFSYDTKLIKNFAKRCFIRCFRTEVPVNLMLHIDPIVYHGVSYKRESRIYRVIRSHTLGTRVSANVLHFRLNRFEEVFFLFAAASCFCKSASRRRCWAKVHPRSLIAHKDELVVMIPTVLLGVHPGLQLLGVAPGGAGAAATR